MAKTVRIGLIGDYDSSVRAHVAIPKALGLASQRLECDVLPSWLPTTELEAINQEKLMTFDGLWCVPASPYASMEGALRTIQFAREKKRPFLGTCGGFQHALIEYARNVLGLEQADHLESNPVATLPFITSLACSLVGAKGRIQFVPDSKIATIYGTNETEEEYHCNFGLNPDYKSLLHGEIRITGTDENGEVRVVESVKHPFFIATLFQPELSALYERKHPLVAAFVQACYRAKRD